MLDDLHGHRLRPTGRPTAGRAHILTSVRVRIPTLGLDVPLEPRLALRVRRGQGRADLRAALFERGGARCRLMGKLDLAAMRASVRFPASNRLSSGRLGGPRRSVRARHRAEHGRPRRCASISRSSSGKPRETCRSVLGRGVPPPAERAAIEPADLVLLGGRIVTLEERMPEAEALAARGGRIVAVGPHAEIAASSGPATRVVDLAGRLAVPGLHRRPRPLHRPRASPGAST